MYIFHQKKKKYCWESVSFSLNANLENYFRKAIIHLTSPQVQFQSPAFPQAKHSTASQDELWRKYCISFIYCVLFQETITIWGRRGEDEAVEELRKEKW